MCRLGNRYLYERCCKNECRSCVIVKFREVGNKDVLITRFVLHRKALSAKTLPPELKDIMNGTVKTISYIRGQSLHSRYFET